MAERDDPDSPGPRVIAVLPELVTALDQRRDALAVSTEQLRVAQEQLLAEERLNTIGRLVAEMAGELQARSASLSLLLGLVRQTVQDSQVQLDADQAWRGLGGLRELLGQVRDYTRATTSTPVFRAVHPRALLGQTMELFLMEELGHRCPTSARLDADVGNLVVDATRLQQSLLALLRNAARASQEGQPISMVVQLGANGGVVIEVSDQGQGMSKEQLEHAREPFYSNSPTPGIGLGLEIARLGAVAHGGVIELESTPGQGTLARILLPSAVVEAPHGP